MRWQRPLKLTKARSDGLFLLLVGSVAFVWMGWHLATALPAAQVDFKTAYFSARCLVERCDPYRPDDVLRLYAASGAQRPTDTADNLFTIARNVYPPSEFAVTLPFAMLPYRLAQFFWLGLLSAGIVAAAYLAGFRTAGNAPTLAGALLCFFLLNCVSLLFCGNPAGLAVGLGAVGAWCFVEERWIPVGIVSMAASLALKPQDAGLVWLYFLLSGKLHRRRALQSLAVVAVAALAMLPLAARDSPHWTREMGANLAAFTVHGGTNDPGPASAGGHGVCMITDMQVLVSFLRDDPAFYNPVSYALCAPLVLSWIFLVVRARPSRAGAWFALAAVAPLSMLPLYHRQYDAKLVLLTVPACAVLWSEGSPLRRWAVGVTLAVFAVIGDFSWVAALSLLNGLARWIPAMPEKAVAAAMAFPAPVTLLAMAGFYLWAFARRTGKAVSAECPAAGLDAMGDDANRVIAT